MTDGTDWIVPDWPAPANVRALMTTRNGGVSDGPWAGHAGGGMNLGLGSGDAREAVLANRALLERDLPSRPAWLQQVHGTRVVDAAMVSAQTTVADASYSTATGTVCAILVADCMPVLFCDRDGSRVAAAHAGWRGLAGGVLEATLTASELANDRTMAWIGPAIGPSRFEVGDDVRDAFIAASGDDSVAAAFMPSTAGKWLADLPALARLRLEACGVRDIHPSGLCTASDPRRFYSYRRDGVTGRMAALIWLDR
ncbi:MAG: peptidoglycan editing factor PgeF [Burkholderiaceae bacterium]